MIPAFPTRARLPLPPLRSQGLTLLFTRRLSVSAVKHFSISPSPRFRVKASFSTSRLSSQPGTSNMNDPRIPDPRTFTSPPSAPSVFDIAIHSAAQRLGGKAFLDLPVS